MFLLELFTVIEYTLTTNNSMGPGTTTLKLWSGRAVWMAGFLIFMEILT